MGRFAPLANPVYQYATVLSFGSQCRGPTRQLLRGGGQHPEHHRCPRQQAWRCLGMRARRVCLLHRGNVGVLHHCLGAQFLTDAFVQRYKPATSTYRLAAWRSRRRLQRSLSVLPVLLRREDIAGTVVPPQLFIYPRASPLIPPTSSTSPPPQPWFFRLPTPSAEVAPHTLPSTHTATATAFHDHNTLSPSGAQPSHSSSQSTHRISLRPPWPAQLPPVPCVSTIRPTARTRTRPLCTPVSVARSSRRSVLPGMFSLGLFFPIGASPPNRTQAGLYRQVRPRRQRAKRLQGHGG